jgi:hypothetical protein
MAESEDSGFLSRWSQRKTRTRAGEVPAAEAPSRSPAVAEAPARPAALPATQPVQPAPADTRAGDEPPGSAPPPLTMHDVSLLTRDADFSRFVAPDVDASVRNAALRKLFSDPHFNVMDGLDTYIDDYGKPDPLPLGMLRKMAQAEALGLFKDEDDSPAAPNAATENPAPHEDPDLRLQSHDAAGRDEPEPHAGEDPGRER